ncbi:carbohydrate-binding family 9-like protein [Anaerophaga thermohalophila]|jgi:hypothetical protein|uniref:carbohydrate-binding family 9-like protein n=1 Tax=Anaerophaga thermohalophila TaxID=177400 RepID=UPI0002F2E3A7|nr:carbohydrate-binding family 9-like protein [Anaerophaga thermohalophila]
MTKQLIVPKIGTQDIDSSSISDILDEKGVKGSIDKINWKEYPYQPEVSFAMAYNEENLFLKFHVRENHIRAMETEPNGNVWEDSCCEFFCAFDDKGYYNIETNCIGTQLIGWGRNRKSRTRLSAEIINAVVKQSTLGQKTIEPLSGDFDYQLTLIIPASTFVAHSGLKFMPGMRMTGNFYKCGDKTPEPNFVSWNPIEIEKPDFHRPDYFGQIELGQGV